MNRRLCLQAWLDYYGALDRQTAIEQATARSSSLRERMETLGRATGRTWREFVRRELQNALGMAYGVHRQLLWGLHSLPEGGKLRVAGGLRTQIEARRATFSRLNEGGSRV